MKYLSKKLLEDAGITEEAHRFFVLRWKELFDEFTYDSWQVRTTNLQSILHEILESCEVVQKIHSHHPNIEMLIQEGIGVAKDDCVIKKYFPFSNNYLENLNKIYVENVKNREKFNVAVLERNTRVLLGNLDGYLGYLSQELKDLFKAPGVHYKMELDSLTSYLGVELKNRGYSLDELRNSVKLLLNDEISTFEERADDFLSKYSGKFKNYVCLYHITNTKIVIKKHVLGDCVVESMIERPGITDQSETEKEFFGKDRGSGIVRVELSALDPYGAKVLAEQKLEALFAVAKLYQSSKQWIIKHSLVLVKESEGENSFLLDDCSNVRDLSDSKKPENDIDHLFGVISKINAKTSDQLISSLQYHKLALSATTDESKFINLWIGLEALVQGEDGSIIQRLQDYIPAINSLNYIKELSIYFPVSIRELWREKDTSEIREKLAKSKEYRLEASDFIKILLSDENGELVKSFCQLISEDPLSVFRAERLYKEKFSSPDCMKKAIEKHNKNVGWQLCRIYRIRNQIMHQGYQGKDLGHLIEHLHTYFITAIHTLAFDLHNHNSWTIFDSLEHRARLYANLLSRLTNYEKHPICQASLMNTSYILKSKFGDPAWARGV